MVKIRYLFCYVVGQHLDLPQLGASISGAFGQPKVIQIKLCGQFYHFLSAEFKRRRNNAHCVACLSKDPYLTHNHFR